MKKSTLLLAALAFGSFAASAEQMTGYISEAHCGAKHSTVSEANSKCISGCLKGGSDPVLVSDGKVMKFDAESVAKAKPHAGEMVKIDGKMEGDSIKIDSIETAK
jgi:hypothetical protein